MLNRENILKNHALNQEYVSASLSLDSDYNSGTRNLLADVNGNYLTHSSIYGLQFPFLIYFGLSYLTEA